MGDGADIEAARQAWKRLQKGGRRAYSDWVTVGKALQTGREEALAKSGAARPQGGKFNAEMGLWLRASGLDAIPPPVRCSALRMIENLEPIETWRATLTPAERDTWAHPDSNYRLWRRSQRGTPRRTEASEPAPSDLWAVVQNIVHEVWDIGDELVAAQKIYNRIALHLNPRRKDKPRQRATAAEQHAAA